jgi:hypothetical protein
MDLFMFRSLSLLLDNDQYQPIIVDNNRLGL